MSGVSPIWLEPAAICRARASSSDFTFCGSSFTFFFLLCPPSCGRLHLDFHQPPPPPPPALLAGGPLFQTGYVDATGAANQEISSLDEWGALLFLCVIFQKKKKKGGKKLPPLFCRHFRLPPAQPSWNIFCFLQKPAPAPSVEALNMEIYLPPFSSKKKKTSRLEHWNFVVVGPFGRMNTAVGKRRKNSGRLLDFF